MLVHCRVTPSNKFAGTHLYTWVERDKVRVKCLAQEHNTVSPARARTRTARSGDERTKHETNGGYSQKNRVGVYGPLPKSLTLFMTKICDFPYPIYDLSKNLVPIFMVPRLLAPARAMRSRTCADVIQACRPCLHTCLARLEPMGS